MQACARKAIGSLNHDGTPKRLQSGGMLLVGARSGCCQGDREQHGSRKRREEGRHDGMGEWAHFQRAAPR